ncbi:MAG: GNAT family N-acetyltransferase [Solobacterium sp.]|nr:GNAT family N-acetyltransferase [Solobacterium sp.]
MIDIQSFSDTYTVRRLTEEDIPAVVSVCKGNPQFYAYTSFRPDAEQILDDLYACPPGKNLTDKYYCGFFHCDELCAVIDVIDGYPDAQTAFIGFFMLKKELQGNGEGTRIMEGVYRTLQSSGFARARLCIDMGNPQSGAFWAKNGFRILRAAPRGEESVWLAEKDLK